MRTWKMALTVVLLSVMMLSTAYGQASRNIRDRVTVLKMNNPAQQFELAAKLQWHAGGKKWDRVLVVYNGHAEPPLNHPVWSYLSNLRIPNRPGKKPGENVLYKAFYKDAFCNGVTPLASNRPVTMTMNNATPGAYGKREFFRDWNCPGWNTGMRHVSIVNAGKQSRGLQLNLVRGQVGCAFRGGDNCTNWKPHLGARLNSVTYSYWIKLPQSFDFAAGGRLPGVGSVVPLEANDKPNGQNGWSVQGGWNAQGQLGQYLRYVDQPGAGGVFMPWKGAVIKRGVWHQVKTQVRVNTPGQRNGTVVSWLDGRQVFAQGGLRFRNTDKLLAERLLFEVFYDKRSSQSNQSVFIDEFMVLPR